MPGFERQTWAPALAADVANTAAALPPEGGNSRLGAARRREWVVLRQPNGGIVDLKLSRPAIHACARVTFGTFSSNALLSANMPR
jgi:hypothetical protein